MKKKNLFIILTILSIVILGIGGTFAYYTTSAVATNIAQIKSGNLTMTIDGGGNTNASFMPAKCTSEYAIKKKIVATSNNTSGGKVSFSIGMNVATLSDSLKTATMKYALSTSSDSCTDGLIASGNFSNATVGDDIWLVKNDYDNITQSSNDYTKTYYLYIWLDETETQNLSGSISVNMKGTSSNNPSLKTKVEKEKVSLYNYIKNNADTTTTIDFSYESSQWNDSGIYMTADTDLGKPVYYYSGDVDNHLIFANFCWRILRTTETGGVKLIYDGVPSNGQCNNTGDATSIGNSTFNSSSNNAKYVGYMYGSSIDDTANTTDSAVKTFIDTWYKNNMTSYTSQLEDTVFCNDRSYTKTDSTLYFGAYTRLMDDNMNRKPTLKCQNTKDKFTTSTSNGNGALTYPVGLITADEMAYAGVLYYISSFDANFYNFLFTEVYTSTMSPYAIFGYNDIEIFAMDYNGYLSSNSAYTGSGRIRPVLSLKPGIGMTGGSGTSADPFIVE